MGDGPASGLALVDAILERGDLDAYTWHTLREPTSSDGWGERPTRTPPTSVPSN
jgi:hypothetical protein